MARSARKRANSLSFVVAVQVHLVDGTFELFRCFHGAPRHVNANGDSPVVTKSSSTASAE